MGVSMQFKQLKIGKMSVFAVVLMSLGLLAGCKEEQSQVRKQTVAVNVFKVNPVNYQLKVSLPGRTVASEIAEIRPQVNGIIQKREFAESSMVKQGQSLYQIDPTIYQAQYDSAQASLNNANLKLKRYQSLLKTRSVSQQDYDEAFASQQEAQANFNIAKTNLEYTKVVAPISGYIGMSNVTEGALVSADQTNALAVIRKYDPMYIDMTQSAVNYMNEQIQANRLYEPMNKVNLYLNDGSLYPEQGEVKFVDRSVNQTTGTVTIRSEFKNPEGEILSGMFVRPELILGEIKDAILVPQPAITMGPNLTYSAVIVVPNKQEKAEDPKTYHLEQRNNIKIYQSVAGYWIVTEGINAGDVVVTRGLMSVQGKNLNDPKVQESLDIVINETKTLTQQEADQF